jgi:serine/threonine-protein kinase
MVAADEATQSPLEVGQVLAGKYRVERQIGRGGMGVVLAATHLQLEHQVAIKVLRRDLLEDDKALTRLLSEARAAAKIRSEHVARVLDVGTLENGSPFIVMEYLEGEDLADLLDRQGALDVPQAVQFLLQSCEALAEVHAAEMVHRDLKPGNLFIARLPDGSASLKIVDFGISKHIGPSAHATAATTSAQVLGSPYYMPPEQMRAEPVDERSDIWSLGAILFEMLTARPPFLGETLPEVYAAVLAQPAPRVVSLRPDVPPGLDEIVQRCLDKDPAQRFCDVADLAEALAPFGNSRSAHSVERVSRILSNPNLFRAPGGNTPKVLPVAEPATARGGIAVEPALKATPVIGVGPAKPVGPPLVTPALVTPAIASQARRTSSSEVGPLSATGSHPDLEARAGGRGARMAWAALAVVTVAVAGVLTLRSSGAPTPEPVASPSPRLAASQPSPPSPDVVQLAPPAASPRPAEAPPPVPTAPLPDLQVQRQALKPALQPLEIAVQGARAAEPSSHAPTAEKKPQQQKKPEHEKVEKRAKPQPVAAKSSAPSAVKSAPATHSETRSAPPAAKPGPQHTGAGPSSDDPWNPSSFGDRH